MIESVPHTESSMRLFARLSIVLGALALTPAYAQEAGISGELEQSTTTTPREKAQFADGALAEIEGAVKTVETLLKDAENAKEKNAEAIECLTRKLTPLRALAEVSRQSNNSMKQFLAANDPVHADQEFRKVAVALTKAREFLAEAQACVGDTGVQRGDSSATVTDGGDNYVDEGDVPPIDEIPAGDQGTER